MARPAHSSRPSYDKDRLTDVAIRVFMARGYDATRISHIAKAADISTSSVYHHVANKEEFLSIALRRSIDLLLAILEHEQATTGSPKARLEYILQRIVETELHLHAELALLLRVRGNTEVEQWAVARRREVQSRFVGVVKEAQEAGELPTTVPAALYARLMLGTANSIVEWYRPDGTWSPSELGDAVVRMVFGSLAEEPVRGSAKRG
jgi:AcrR family transcriptional regulator